MAGLDLLVGPAPDFSGKVVIVTGGTSGIGQSMVSKFAEQGANVIISDLNAPPATPHNSLFIHTDVTSWSSQVKLFQQTIERFGKIDVSPLSPSGQQYMSTLSELWLLSNSPFTT